MAKIKVSNLQSTEFKLIGVTDEVEKMSEKEMISIFGGGGIWHWDDYWEQWTDSFTYYA